MNQLDLAASRYLEFWAISVAELWHVVSSIMLLTQYISMHAYRICMLCGQLLATVKIDCITTAEAVKVVNDVAVNDAALP